MDYFRQSHVVVRKLIEPHIPYAARVLIEGLSRLLNPRGLVAVLAIRWRAVDRRCIHNTVKRLPHIPIRHHRDIAGIEPMSEGLVFGDLRAGSRNVLPGRPIPAPACQFSEWVHCQSLTT